MCVSPFWETLALNQFLEMSLTEPSDTPVPIATLCEFCARAKEVVSPIWGLKLAEKCVFQVIEKLLFGWRYQCVIAWYQPEYYSIKKCQCGRCVWVLKQPAPSGPAVLIPNIIYHPSYAHSLSKELYANVHFVVLLPNTHRQPLFPNRFQY